MIKHAHVHKKHPLHPHPCGLKYYTKGKNENPDIKFVWLYDVSSFKPRVYRRPGFDCEILLIANCEFFYNSQSKESQEKEYAVTRDHAPFVQTRVFNHVQLPIVEMSIRRYSSIFQVNSQPANTQPSATVAKRP